MKDILRIKNISKTYSDEGVENKVLKDVTFSIHEGEFVSIMGPSGSGKSTLLYAVSGMEHVDEGEILVGDVDITNVCEEELTQIRRKKMGYVFQQPNLLKNLNIMDNIVFLSLLDNRQANKEIKEKASSLMKQTGIDDIGNRSITKVSGGQLQRAGICRALMNDPDILFADEPTGALNSKATKDIMDIFTDLNEKGNTIMLVTHDAKVALRSERILFMKDGCIVEELELGKYKEDKIDESIKKISSIMNKLDI